MKHILILRFRRVGDAVLSSALCSSLRKTFPEAQIDYVLNEEIAPLFEHHPAIDRVITFNRSEMHDSQTYLKKVWQIVHATQYDAIIDTRSTVKTLWFSLFSFKTPFRIGKQKSYNLFLHNYRFNTCFDGTDDEVGYTLRLLSPFEKRVKVHYDRNFKVVVTPEEKAAFRRKMENQGIDFSKPVMVCAVATRLSYKMWPQERMTQVLSKILETTDAQLVFNFVGKTEEAIAVQIQKDLHDHPRIFTNIEANNLRELAAMLANSDFFFGNEGGPRHISQALNIPSFAIYPPNIPKKDWLPNANERFRGIEPADVSEQANNPDLSYAEKFDFITVDEVWSRLSFLNRL
ncbi:heptosyltransferase [Bacteroidia bacterium]|nr:heptosyltransferase [Bacteroidia bacterium]